MAIPKITLSAGTFPKEGTVGTYLITLDSAAPAGGLVVNFNTIGSTATFLTDYNLFAGTNITAVTANSFTIAAGQTTANLNVRVFGDTFVESNETVNLNLMAGTGYQQINNTTSFSKVDYITGVAPNGVAVADINRDGKLDLVTANWVNNTVSILLRNATNTGFDAKVDFATGKQPYSVSIGDFNRDGKPDLAVANFTSNTVSVLLRNAANTGFSPKVDYTTGNGTTFVSTGDFNNDGKTDLIIANQNANSVSVLLRNAANTGFNTKVNYATGSVPQSVRVGDFNGDGKLDFVVGNAASNTVSVFVRNAANTGFDAKVNYATGVNPLVSVGDFNGDGKLDIATANAGSNTVSVLLRNAANNGFDAKTDYVVGSSPHSISVADFNNDGKLDLAVTNQGSNTVSLLLRNSLNTGFNSQLQYATGSRPSFGGVGDFNKDGKVDLVVTNSGTNTVSVFSNTSSSSATLTIVDNKPPVLTGSQAVLANGTEDMAYRILAGNLLQGFSDADSALSVTNLTATNGSLTAISGGWRFTPTANYNGVVALNYFVTDGAALISATRSFVLAAVNDAATATNLSTAESYIEDTALNLTNIVITDVDSANVTATLTLSNTAAGSLNVATSGAVTSTYNAGVWTATGAKASVNALLADLTFTPAADFNGNFTIATSVSDGDAAAVTGSKSFTGVAVNDAPVFSGFQSSLMTTEDSPPYSIGNWQLLEGFSDADGDTLSVANLTVSSGTVQENAVMVGWTVFQAENFCGNVDLTYNVIDGKGGSIAVTRSIQYEPVNDPAFFGLGGGSVNFTKAGAAVVLDSDITLTDVDFNISNSSYSAYLNYAELTLERHGGANSDDVFSFAAVSDGDIVISNISIGMFSQQNGTLRIFFTQNATQALVNQALHQIKYSNSSNTPPASVQIDWTFSDGVGFGINSFTTNTTTVKIIDPLVSTTPTAGNDSLTGTAGNDTIDGLAGADTMTGGLGNDAYFVDNTGDIVTETSTLATEIDTVNSSITYTLPANVENLVLTGTATINGIGNSLNNVFTGNSGVNNFWGKAGDDTYIVNKITYVGENLNEGIDTVMSSVSYALNDNVENLTLTGTASIDGVGNSSDNVFTGNAGVNNFWGKAGDDTYIVNKATYVGENLNEGIDTVMSSVTYGLNDNVENLTLTGTANIDGVGNSLDNVFTGNKGINNFFGKAGNDTYYVNKPTHVGENVNEGTDTVFSSANYALNDNVENLTLTGKAYAAVGNDLDNVLTGNLYDNVLNGKGGADTLIGGLGNDIYIVDDSNTVVVEASKIATEIDTVNSSITYTLGVNLENIILTASAAVDGIGNIRDNTLTGNVAANKLSGNGGNDTLMGGQGQDTLTGGVGADSFKFTSVNQTGVTVATCDTITDFKTTDADKIDLSAIDANTVIAGDDAFVSVTVGNTFSGLFANTGELYFDQLSRVLYGNNDSDTAADFSILLTGVATLSATDFVL